MPNSTSTMLFPSLERMHQTCSPNSLRLTLRGRQRKHKEKEASKKPPAMQSSRHLPPELWLMVLDHLPPSFFQEDIGRLTLCKRWYYIVFPIFLRRLELT